MNIVSEGENILIVGIHKMPSELDGKTKVIEGYGETEFNWKVWTACILINTNVEWWYRLMNQLIIWQYPLETLSYTCAFIILLL